MARVEKIGIGCKCGAEEFDCLCGTTIGEALDGVILEVFRRTRFG